MYTIYTYTHMCIYTYIYIWICIYVYIQKEREREKERERKIERKREEKREQVYTDTQLYTYISTHISKRMSTDHMCVSYVCIPTHAHIYTYGRIHTTHRTPCVCVCVCVYTCTLTHTRTYLHVHTGWRRCIGCLKLQVSFRKTAMHYRALLRKMTYADKTSYVSSPSSINCCSLTEPSFMGLYVCIEVSFAENDLWT